MAEKLYCCICGEALTAPNLLGQRAYCAKHFAAVNKPHAGFWRSALLQLVLMGTLALGITLLGNVIGPLDGPALWIAGVLLAVIPSLLWLWFFYREDQLEPEPKTRLLQVLLVGAGVYELLGRPIINHVFHVQDWSPRNSSTSLLANLLIVGVIYQITAYIALRTVSSSDAMDERMDGIVYGTAAGLGVAMMLNLRYVIDNGGVALGPGIVHTVTTALAQASFAGLMGWFVAEAKFTHKPGGWVPLGFALATLMNGLFTWLIREAGAAGLDVSPLRSLGLGLLVAVAAFFVLVALMRRSVTVTLSR